MRDEVIDYLVKTGLIETCVKFQVHNLSTEDMEDLVQELWLWVMEYPQEKLLDAYNKGHLNALITAVIKRNVQSVTSPFYRKYRRFSALAEPIERIMIEEEGYEEGLQKD